MTVTFRDMTRVVTWFGPLRVCIFALIVTLYFGIPNARPDFTRWDTFDGESYIALARSLVDGRGYTRSLIDGAYLPHRLYPPGLPIILTLPVALGGHTVNWLLLKSAIVLIGLGGILLVWGLVRRLTEHRTAADLAALLVALNPFYWHFSHQTMPEVPVAVWILGSLLLIDRLWQGGLPTYSRAWLAGLICGLGMMVKGSAVGLVFVPLAYCEGFRRSYVRGLLVWVIFLGGFAVPQLAWMTRNALVEVPTQNYDAGIQAFAVLTSNAMQPGSPTPPLSRRLRDTAGRARHSVIYTIPVQVFPGLWRDGAFDFKGSGWVALAATTGIVALAFRPLMRLMPLQLALASMAGLFLCISFGETPRYWVPVSVFLLALIAAQLGTRLAQLTPVRRRTAWAAIAVVLALNLLLYIREHERHPYNRSAPYAELAALFEIVARSDLRTSGVFTPNSVTFQLIAGRPAPLVDLSPPLTYQHMIARVDGLGPILPTGSRLVTAAYPWELAELPRAMTSREIVDHVRVKVPVLPYAQKNRRHGSMQHGPCATERAPCGPSVRD